MTAWLIKSFLLCLLNVAAALFLSPLCEGIMRKLRAAIHSRIGPPITQPYWDLLKLLCKEDLRSSGGMMMLLSVEPILAIALSVGAFKAKTLAVGGIVNWQVQNGPCISMAIAGVAFFLALQAVAGKLPFDIAEADQEIMGGPLVEQSGPRLALFRWAMWVKQLVLAFLLVEVFFPWPHLGNYLIDLAATIVKVLIVLVLVAVIDVVNPRLRIDQALGYYMRVAFSSLAALAFAVIGK